jgi:general secretion pathway protein D
MDMVRRCLAAFLCVVLVAPVSVPGQDTPKIEGPTLRPAATDLPPAPPPATVPTKTGMRVSSNPDEKPSLTVRWESAPAAAALQRYSDLTGRTVIQNAALSGVVSLDTKTMLTTNEMLLAIESVLFANGISLTPMGDKFVKAAANQAIAREGIAIAGADAEFPEGDRITATVIPLQYLDVGDASIVQSLSQFIHQPGGTILPLTRSNSLLIIDTTLIVKRLQEILERLDQKVENRIQTYYRPLTNAEASKVAATIQALITGSAPATGGAPRPPPRPGQPATVAAGPTEESIVAGKVIIQADERTNTLIILTRPSNLEFLEGIISALDAKVEPEIRFKKFKLEHARAEDAADILLSLTGSGSQPTIQRRASTTQRADRNRLGRTSYGSSARDRTQTGAQQPQPQLPPIARQPTTPTGTTATQPGQGVERPDFVLSERARVIADPRQGSILVLGTASDLELVEMIIPEIDLALAQVMIESIIVEVTLDNNAEFGVNILQREWEKGSNKGGGASLPSVVATNALQKLAFLRDPQQFAASGLAGLGGLTYFLDLGGLDLDVIVRAVAGSSNFKVLQRPLLQSSQNEPAHIFVGETRPIITATQTSFTGDDALRSTIEQFDIGVTLDVTPNITPGGLVELEVEQTVEDVSGEVRVDNNLQPIVSRRELTSLVSVRDRGVVALGGLIKNGKTKTESKVPILGDIPLLSYAFKQTSWKDSRIELIVFLRPTVLRSADEAMKEAQKLRNKFKGLDNIPKQDVPALPEEPGPPEKKPWYAPLQPPPS